MQSVQDVRRLRSQYFRELARPLATVTKCAAGLMTLFVVAAGPWMILTADGPGIPGDAAQAATVYPSSVAESRRVFEERRQRAQSVQETAKAALAE